MILECEPMYAIQDTENKGAAFIVTSPIQAGTAILNEEPFEAVVHNDVSSKRSHWTLRHSDSLQRCSGCKYAWYVTIPTS